MGDSRKVFAAIFMSVVLLSTGLFVSADAFSEKRYKTNTTQIIHLGYLQLASHDFFDMNRSTEVDNENGKLDMSTVLFNPQQDNCNFEKSLNHEDGCSLYDDADIANGGEIRSSASVLIGTASAEVGGKYLKFVNDYGEEEAYDRILEFYHTQLRKAYEETYHLEFPEPQAGEITNLHNLAMRSGHDLLPARIMFDGCVLPDDDGLCSVFIIDPRGEKLSEKEQRQASAPVDGFFEPEFLGLNFCPVPPDFCIVVDLLHADRSFGADFGLGADTFDGFMTELKDGSFDETDDVSILIREAYSRGLYLD